MNLMLYRDADVTGLVEVIDPENSECRAPGDDYYPVRTTLYIDFPIVTCYSPECIILDPIELVSESIEKSDWMATTGTLNSKKRTAKEVQAKRRRHFFRL